MVILCVWYLRTYTSQELCGLDEAGSILVLNMRKVRLKDMFSLKVKNLKAVLELQPSSLESLLISLSIIPCII